ncbi:MAG TPA: hypothetical protein VK947_03445 [Planococcus sp. (in: firmicutes)]|nr:hypothetical protein [Planococcus sp. (in: firmicutes)]
MGKNKIQPLILSSLTISAVTMVLFAYANLSAGYPGYGVVFIVLATALAVVIIFGLLSNRKLANRK